MKSPNRFGKLNGVSSEPCWDRLGIENPNRIRLITSSGIPARTHPYSTWRRRRAGRAATSRNGSSSTALNFTATATTSIAPADLSRRASRNAIEAVSGTSMKKSLWNPPTA